MIDPEALVLGIDGGGTSTRACLMDADGRIRGVGRSGPSSVDTVGPERTRASLLEACAQARIAEGSTRPVVRALAGIGGIVSALDESEVEAMLREIPCLAPGAPCRAMNDMKTALAAGTGLEPGIVCILGTGSVAYGRNARGDEHKSGGWGWKEGDPGSSFDLGMGAIRAYVRAGDGRLPESGLTRAIGERLGLAGVNDITRVLYREDLGRTAIAALAPEVTAWAERGDAQALAILDRSAGEIAACIQAVFAKLFADSRASVPVAVVGSLGTAPGPYREALTRAVAARENRLVLRPALVEPVVGAAWMALADCGVRISPDWAGRLGN